MAPDHHDARRAAIGRGVERQLEVRLVLGRGVGVEHGAGRLDGGQRARRHRVDVAPREIDAAAVVERVLEDVGVDLLQNIGQTRRVAFAIEANRLVHVVARQRDGGAAAHAVATSRWC